MIVVSLPQQRELIKEHINHLTVEDIIFEVVEESKIDLLIKCNIDDEEKARKVLKKEIKTFVGTMIYFGIRVK